jgi:hypothetical protein
MARNDARPPSANTQITVTTAPDRVDIVRRFARLPDEAFGNLIGMMLGRASTAGGFQPDSRAALEALRLPILAYIDSKSENPQIHETKEST